MHLLTGTTPVSSICYIQTVCRCSICPSFCNFPVPSRSSFPSYPNSSFGQVRRKLRVWQLKSHFWEVPSDLRYVNNDATRVVQPSTTVPVVEEEPFAIILTEITQLDGTVNQILFSSGGELDVYDVQALYVKASWGERSPEKLATALKNSYMVATLHSMKKSPDAEEKGQMELIGLARVTSDGAFFATIWDVLVDPNYQDQELGKALIEQLVRALRRRKVRSISVFADSKGADFYQKLGFKPESKNGFQGMYWSPTY